MSGSIDVSEQREEVKNLMANIILEMDDALVMKSVQCELDEIRDSEGNVSYQPQAFSGNGSVD